MGLRPLIYKYPLDLTGINPNNLVMSEPHTLEGGAVRAIVPNYGAFFTEGLVIHDAATGLPLVKYDQYKAAQLYQEATEKTGKEVCAVIVITDPTVSSNIEITYQAIGGEFSYSVFALRQMLEDIDLDTYPVEWGSIIGTPDYFPPAPHLHDAGDLYGFEYLTEALEALRHAILTGDEAAHEELRALITAMGVSLSDSFIASLQQHIESSDHDTRYLKRTDDTFSGSLDILGNVTFEGGKHGISYNDGSGNFNIKVATSMDNQSICQEAGYGTHLKYTQSAGRWDFNISNESRLPGEMYTWANPISFTKDKVTFNVPLEGTLNGVAAIAKKLETPRTIGITGDASWSVTFDGSGNVTAALTLANSGATAGAYGNNITVPTLTVDAKGRVTSVSNTAIRAASTTQSGLVQLSNSADDTSTTKAPTSKALNDVKKIFDNGIYVGNDADTVTGPSFTWKNNLNTGLYLESVSEIAAAVAGEKVAGFSSTRIWSKGDVVAFSDIRFKDNIEKITDPLNKVLNLNGYTYNRNDLDGIRQIGVIAQELEKIVPEAVHTDLSGIKSVAYANLTALLIEAVKELNVKVDKLLAAKGI